MLRRLAPLACVLVAASCHTSSPPRTLARVADVGPPSAPVTTVLTPIGPLDPDERQGAEATATPRVVEVGPEAHNSGHEPIFLRFSHPMDQTGPRPQVTLVPEGSGSLTWTDPYRLVFTPEAGLAPATRFEVHAHGAVRARTSEVLKIDSRWSFETPRPTATLWDDGTGRWSSNTEIAEVHWKSAFHLETSHEVGKTALRKAVSVVASRDGESARSVPFRLVGAFSRRGDTTTTSWAVRPRGHWPASSKVELRLASTLTTAAGPLGTGRDLSHSFHTDSGVEAEVVCSDEAPDGCAPSNLEVRFDSPVSQSVARKVRVSPRPKGLEIDSYWKRSDGTVDQVYIAGEFKPGTTYTVTLQRNIVDQYGQRLVGDRSHEIDIVEPPPLLQLSGDAVLLDVGKGTVGIESRRVQEAELSLSTLDDAALAQLVSQDHDAQHRPEHGARTTHRTLKMKPSGAYGWDARALHMPTEFGAAHGAAYLELAPKTLVPSQAHRADIGPSHALIQLTDLGAVIGLSPSKSFVRVSSLATAEPIEGAEATVYDTHEHPPRAIGSFGPSDARGVITLPASTELPDHAAVVLHAGEDDRFALRLYDHAYRHSRHYSPRLEGHAYDIGVLIPDRNLYQPGEKVRVMGWVARSSTKHFEGLEGSEPRPVHIRLKDSRDNQLAETTVRTKAYGKFWATLRIPEDAALGRVVAYAKLEGADREFRAQFKLREFEAPAFNVHLNAEASDLRRADVARFRGSASYLHGMPLPIQSARIQTRCGWRSFRPPGSGDVLFAMAHQGYGGMGSTRTDLQPQDTYARGVMEFEVATKHLSPGDAQRCETSVAVQDVARQEVGATAKYWVHPEHYLSISAGDRHSTVGERLRWDVRARDWSGTFVDTDPVTVTVYALRDLDDGESTRRKVSSCTVRPRADTAASCAWTPRKAGQYEVVLHGTVDGADVEASQALNVGRTFGSGSAEPTHRFEVQTPSEAGPSNTVQVQIDSPHDIATGFVVNVHAGIREIHPFRTKGHAATVSLTATDAWIPATYLSSFLTLPNSGRKLPDLLSKHSEVQIRDTGRRLQVEVDNPAAARIREDVPISVLVRDAKGTPIEGAHVSVWAVDEGILALAEWSFPDLVHALVADRGDESAYYDAFDRLRRHYTVRADPYDGGIGLGTLGGIGQGFGAGASGRGGGGGRGRASPARVRKDFDPAPIFVGDVETDARGRARIVGTLPDNLTTFRIAAIATAEVGQTGAFSRAGQAESRVRVTQDLAIRPVLPRVLRPSDSAVLGALVDNLAESSGALDVELELLDNDGVVDLESPRRVHRDDFTQSQLRIPFTVTARKPGTVRVRATAIVTATDGSTRTDASEFELSVVPEVTLVHQVATSSSFDEEPAQAVELQLPEQYLRGSAQVAVDVFTSLLGGYQDNVRGLITYPYGCLEQTSTRLVPLVALHDLSDYPLGVDDVDAFIAVAIRRLSELQTRSGGFGYWPDAKAPHLYATAYATWVLSRASEAGIEVPQTMLSNASDYLLRELGRYRERGTPTGHEDVRAAMALHALAEQDQTDAAVLNDLLSRPETLPSFARALLLMAAHRIDADDPRLSSLLASIERRIDVRADVARSKAESVRFSQYFDSPMRTDAMVLMALLQVQPDHPTVEKLARGLTAAREAGRLRNTQENAYAILAMAAYAAVYEDVAPELDVRAWLDDAPLLQATFQGRELGNEHASGSLRRSESPTKITLARTGLGRLYYRVGMRWSPRVQDIEPRSAGLAIERTLRSEGSVVDAHHGMKEGAAGTIDVRITADMRQRYVVLEIPLPAGLEAVDTSLGAAGSLMGAVSTVSGVAALRYDHRELRGDRVLVFVDDLPAGSRRVVIPVRATHQGRYSFPPARAEAMYAPEVAGNTAGTVVTIDPA